MQISILKTSISGSSVYTETHLQSTNANGLVSLEIGTGNTTGDFSSINWSNDTYFVKTETDPTGGTNYTISGTSQLLSVPYALHAKTAETALSVTNDLINDADSVVGNEYNTTVVLNGTNLEITDGGGTITTNLSGLQDHLGNHTATANIQTNGQYISTNGTNEGIYIDLTGQSLHQVIFGLSGGNSKRVQTIFQMVGHMRRAKQVVGAGHGCLCLGGGDRLGQIDDVETFTADPHDGNQLGLLVLAQPLDKGA